MGTGWLLDITDDPGGSGVVLWLKDAATRKVEGRYAEFRPPFLVTGPARALSELVPAVSARRDVAEVVRRTQRVSILEERPRPTLVVTARRNPGRRRVADAIDAMGGYHAFQLYDVDLGAPQLYHLTHGLYPFAAV